MERQRLGYRRGRWSVAVAFLALLAPAALIGAGFWGFSYDDAFITYRYARNWAGGQGLVYNPGEPVLGTTAPGYALLLGLLSRLSGVPVPAWGTVLSLLALSASATLLSAAAELPGRNDSRAALAVLAGATAVVMRWNVEMLGAETFVVLALAIAAGLLAERGRQVAAGLLAAAAMACRLDAGLAAAALGLVLWVHRRRFPWRFATAGLVPLVLWLIWLQAQFGTVIPNSLAGKQSEFPLAPEAYSAAEWLWLRRTVPLSGALALVALAAVGLVTGYRQGTLQRPLFAALALWLALHEAMYRLLHVPFAPWYHVHLLFALVWLAAFGALTVSFWLAARTTLPGPELAGGIALLLLLPVLLPSCRFLGAHWRTPPDPRIRIYAAAGHHLDRMAAGSAAAVEIGYLGWAAARTRILDLGGLVSPKVLAAKAADTLPLLVAAERPLCLVDAPVFQGSVVGAILEQPEVAAAYFPVASFRTPEYEGGTVRLLCRARGPRDPPAARGGPG